MHLVGGQRSDTGMRKPWLTLIGDYDRSQRAAGRSTGTIRLHRHYLLGLAELAPELQGITLPVLEQFLSNPTWAPETRKSARAAVRGFCRWMYGRTIEHDPSDTRRVRVPAGDGATNPEHLVRQLVAASDRIGTMAMFDGLLWLRRGEIARVHRRDLVGEELLIHGRAARCAPCRSPADLLRRIQSADDWLFPQRPRW